MTANTPKTVWITKYALTSGIQERRLLEVCSERMITVVPPPGEYGCIFFHKPDWHDTKAEAVAQAEKMRVKKLASLEKQIAQLTALRFE